jgi:hypothetical protein
MQIFICGWWLCPELYLRRPFQAHASSRLDNLLEAKAKEGVQVTFNWNSFYNVVSILSKTPTYWITFVINLLKFKLKNDYGHSKDFSMVLLLAPSYLIFLCFLL